MFDQSMHGMYEVVGITFCLVNIYLSLYSWRNRDSWDYRLRQKVRDFTPYRYVSYIAGTVMYVMCLLTK